MDLKQMYWANDIFLKFSTTQKARLSYGLKKREEMRAALMRGDKVEGYRAKWLLQTTMEVIGTLADSAEVFNNTHYHDMISVADMIDVLSTAIARLKEKSNEVK